jgi:hypothetical protein
LSSLESENDTPCFSSILIGVRIEILELHGERCKDRVAARQRELFGIEKNEGKHI